MAVGEHGGGGGGGGQATTLEHTPTWVVAVVCCIIIVISLAVERLLHYGAKYFRKNDKRPLAEALEKIKEELMLLGFISLLLTVFQNRISRICVSKDLVNSWLPCNDANDSNESKHLQTFFFSTVTGGRRLLSETTDYCGPKGKVPFFSITALHHLHLFIFVLAVAHVSLCVLTIVFGGTKVRQWKPWEDAIQEELNDPEKVKNSKVTHVPTHAFIKKHYRGVGKRFALLVWLQSFFKQFFWSVTKLDYETLRRGFIELLLAVGTKLVHIITDLALDVAEKRVSIEGELIVRLSDDHFWFGRPKIVLTLINIILFQNSVELAFFFFIWMVYKFDSCMMGKFGYIIPRLVIGVLVQVLCSYSTLPLYALVTQMGSSFKKEIFEDHIQESIVDWVSNARLRKPNGYSYGQVGRKEVPLVNRESQRNAGEIVSEGIDMELVDFYLRVKIIGQYDMPRVFVRSMFVNASPKEMTNSSSPTIAAPIITPKIPAIFSPLIPYDFFITVRDYVGAVTVTIKIHVRSGFLPVTSQDRLLFPIDQHQNTHQTSTHA
ncbi:hypothetical protein ACFE04_007869 [Oxalis oulophora]